MNYRILYYSGTLCTEYAAKLLKNELEKDSEDTVTLERVFKGQKNEEDDFDRLIVMFPIHAQNAPKSLRNRLKELPDGDGRKSYLISTSSLGDVIPNMSANYLISNILEKKNYHPDYESFLITPSNILYNQREELGAELLKVLPVKIRTLTSEIRSDVSCKSQRNPISGFTGTLGRLQERSFGRFGKMMIVSKSCTGCSKCESLCPEGTITMKDGKPHFDSSCTMCTACVYGCPQNALKSLFMPNLLNRNGFDLEKIKASADSRKPLHETRIFSLTRGVFMNLRRYILQEKNRYQ